jgi:hypothetical protein
MLKFAMKRNKWPAELCAAIMGLVSATLKRTVSLVRK